MSRIDKKVSDRVETRDPTVADELAPTGSHQVRMQFVYGGGGLGKRSNVTLHCDDKTVGTGRVEQTQPMVFS